MVGYGFNPVFARCIYAFGLGSEIIMFYRYVLPALNMSPFLLKGLRQPKESQMAVTCGLMMGLWGPWDISGPWRFFLFLFTC